VTQVIKDTARRHRDDRPEDDPERRRDAALLESALHRYCLIEGI
jgi:hypothetical protein